MQTGKVIEFGQQVQPLLTKQHGNIIAVFAKTVYLHGGENIGCIGTRKLVCGPINIRTDLEKIEALSVGDLWTYTNNTLTLANHYQLETSSAIAWNPHRILLASHHSAVSLNKSLDLSILIIDKALTHHFSTTMKIRAADVTGKLVQQYLQEYSSILSDYLNESTNAPETTKIPAKLKGLIGCGDGLTPAGDDILVGVLVALHYFKVDNKKIPLQKWVRDNASDRTNLISQAHLTAACNGQAVDHLHQVLEAITILNGRTDNERDLEEPLVKTVNYLTGYGHSSGHYALTGVLIVLISLRRNALSC